MSIARISQLDRRTTQSGKANAGLWLLEFERQEPQKAERRGIRYHLVPTTPVRMKIQAYADNFR